AVRLGGSRFELGRSPTRGRRRVPVSLLRVALRGGIEFPVDVEERGVRAHPGLCAESFTRDETRPKPARLERWQIFGAVVLEVGSGLFKFLRQAHPGLEPMHFPALPASALETLGV